MKLLINIDKNNYQGLTKKLKREASRAIIKKGDELLLVKMKNGFYKFPGGGINFSESKEHALIREVKEETGYQVLPSSIKEYGYIKEQERSNKKRMIFVQYSYFYNAQVENEFQEQELETYEADLDLKPEWIKIEDAYKTNLSFIEEHGEDEFRFLKRESLMLKYLLEKNY